MVQSGSGSLSRTKLLREKIHGCMLCLQKKNSGGNGEGVTITWYDDDDDDDEDDGDDGDDDNDDNWCESGDEDGMRWVSGRMDSGESRRAVKV